MDWFEKPDDWAPVVAKARGIARDFDLPFAARSLTDDERVARRTRRIPWWLVGYGLLAALILLLVVGSAGSPGRAILAGAIALPVLGGFGVLVKRAAHDWAGRHGIGDPAITVEIGADGIIVRGADGAYGMRWTEIEAGIIHADEEEETGFAGLSIESPLGRVALCDAHYNDGRAAAALIVRGMHDDHVRREREKVERIG